MVSRPRRLGACLLVAALFGSACSNSAPNGLRAPSLSLASNQTLRVRLGGAPAHLDPALASSPSELAVVRQLAEPLLRPAPDLSDLEPAAAASYDISADGLNYTFHLRENGRYSDGQPVRAQDFVLAWRRVIDPRTGSPWADLFATVTRGGVEAEALDPALDAGRLPTVLAGIGIRALDDLTLELTLPQPMAWARWIAALPAGAPVRAEALTRPGWADHPETSIGNGPFKLASASANEISLGPDLSYWGGRPTLSRLQFLVVPKDAEAVAMFERGELELAGIGSADPAGNQELVRTAELTTFWLAFNTSQPPFDSARVRLALSQAVDRQVVIQSAFQGRGVASTGLLPRGIPGFQPGSAQQFNPESSRQNLDAAGVARDQLGPIRLLVVDVLPDKAVAEVVAQELKRNLGLTITVEAVAPGVYSKRLLAGDFDLAGPQGWTADYPDPQNFYDLFRSSDGRNRSRWRSQRYDLVVRQADAERDQGRRQQLYQQAEQQLEQQAPALFLTQRTTSALARSYVHGSVRTALDEWPGSLYAQRIYLTQHR